MAHTLLAISTNSEAAILSMVDLQMAHFRLVVTYCDRPMAVALGFSLKKEQVLSKLNGAVEN